MADLNKVFLMGNLTRDPELRYTPGGTPVVNLGLAVNRFFKTKEGQNQQDTCFVNVVAWSQTAEASNQYLEKGSLVLVEGRLQSRSWENQEGQKRSVIEVVASRVQFMSQRKGQPEKANYGSEEEKIVNLDEQDDSLGEAI